MAVSTIIARRFARSETASVAVIFAFVLVPLIGILALAVDYSGVTRERVALNSAADAAALVAVSASLRPQSASVAKLQAEDSFRANLDPTLISALDTLDIAVADANGARKVSVSYSATYAGMFGASLGFPGFTVSNTVSASGPAATYIDFYMMLDNSPSMGLGATQADINTLNASLGCAFACHQNDVTPDSYTQAKGMGVKLRIDVVRSATQSLMDDATNAQVTPGQFRMALYTFGATAGAAGLTQLSPLTSNLTSVKSAANGVDLMSIPHQNAYGDALTNFSAHFGAINPNIATPGTGRAGDTPQKVLFFVSDGVNDSEKASCSQPYAASMDPATGVTYNRCQEPLDPNLCKTLKDRGIKIAVLYTSYLPVPTDLWYTTWINPFQPTIGDKMKACASDGLYFEVSPTEGIADAMKALFLKTVTQVSLTH